MGQRGERGQTQCQSKDSGLIPSGNGYDSSLTFVSVGRMYSRDAKT